MKTIKKTIELIEFETINNQTFLATKIKQIDKGIYDNHIVRWVYFETEETTTGMERISEKTYKELLEHLGWKTEDENI